MTRKTIGLILVLLLLTACGNDATQTPGLASSTPAPQISPTAAAPLVILVFPADISPRTSEAYQTLVYDLAQENGMRFQVRNSLSPDELQAELPELKVVISLPPDPGLVALSAAAPGVQFLAVGIPGISAASNLSTIGGADQAVDKQAFLAGYISAMLASEWRVGLLTERETPGGDATWTAFENGYHYFCGYCRNPYFAQPYPSYPIVYRIPTDTPENEYTGWAAGLLDNYVKAAYIYSEVATAEVIAYLAEYGVLLIGQDTPDEEVRDYWIASIQPDVLPAVQAIFPDLVAGIGGQTVSTPLILTDVNEDLLTEGKLRDAQAVLDGLLNGTIGTGVTP